MAPAVVSASVGVLGPLLGKLAGLVAGEYGRLRGVRREILALKCELSSMHAAVQKHTMLEDPDVQVKQWISMVRELAYDIEDCIDKFIHRLGNGGRHGGFKESFRRIARSLKALGARRGIADQIDELNARIRQVKELKNNYKLDDASRGTSNHTAIDPRLSTLFAEESHLVGIDGPRDDLVKWMVEEGNISSKHRRVLSIVGFGGLGKTTMANEVYRKIEGHFQVRAVVSVSQKSDIKKIVKDVISQVSCHDGCTDDWDERKSITKLRELLQNKRYLIIVDDIWSTLAWDAIKCAFPENEYSSRIMVTTRIVDVARSCRQSCDDRIYHMEPLSNLHSKRLFFKRIFGTEDCCVDMLKEVSNDILKKCGGLPLAIISISGLLANVPVAKEEWEKIKTSIGSALQENRSLEGMSSILSLSYNYLPPNLKTCLLYLSAFPEDHLMEREDLVRHWIAEGFISKERGHSQQDVAEHYFYELINKSMVQPVDITHDGKVHTCRVHDMMLEILISKSAEDNFITIVGSGQMSLESHHGVIRRLSVQHIDQDLASTLKNEDLTHVRSLIITTSSGGIKHLPSLDKFEALRVLDFEPCADLEEYILKGLDKLFNLKYLKLRGMGISKLPPGIVMLSNLETLDLRGTNVEELPTGFLQLTKLQHLITENGTKIPNGIADMMNLRVISGFNITQSPSDAVEDLGNLTKLNGLNVQLDSGGSGEHRRHEEMFLSSLCKLGNSKLQYLKINREGGSLDFLDSWSPLPCSIKKIDISINSYFTNFPKWIAPALTNLSFLHINLTELTVEGLRILGELPALLHLHLQLKRGQKDGLTVQGTGFPRRNVFISISNNGENFTFVEGAMPKLNVLHVSMNVLTAKTNGFYSGIGHLPCLREALLCFPSEGATASDDTPAASAIRKEAAEVFQSEANAHPNRLPIMLVDELESMKFFSWMKKSKKKRMATPGTGFLEHAN
uniref:Uncharacterized protein n=2 Tax=Avena sativa TaxID=4498 RepID=A0ACD5WGD1_AVESA